MYLVETNHYTHIVISIYLMNIVAFLVNNIPISYFR